MKKQTVFEKYQLLIVAVIAAILFVYSTERNNEPATVETKIDTVLVENKAITDSLINEIALLNEKLAKSNTIMSEREQQALVRLEQIKYYVQITKKRPQNREFLIGWIERALK